MVRYATRGEVTAPLDIRPDATMASRVDRAIDSASRDVEALCNRRTGFYPSIRTLTFDYPNTQNAIAGRLWLDGNPLISLTSMTSGGTAVSTANVFLRPDDGPPYSYIEIDRSSSSALVGGSSGPQRALSLVGVWGFSNDETTLGTLSAGINASVTSLQLSVPVDVGAFIRIDSERLEVTDRTWTAATETLGASLTASAADETATLSSTIGYVAGETLLVDAERLLVAEVVSGTVLVVRRSWDGTTLAAHSNGASVRRLTTCTVTRGAAGTTAASHLISATVTRWTAPTLVRDLTIAYAMDRVLQESSGYARMVQSSENAIPAPRTGIRDLEKRVYAAYGRKVRHRAV